MLSECGLLDMGTAMSRTLLTQLHGSGNTFPGDARRTQNLLLIHVRILKMSTTVFPLDVYVLKTTPLQTLLLLTLAKPASLFGYPISYVSVCNDPASLFNCVENPFLPFSCVQSPLNNT